MPSKAMAIARSYYRGHQMTKIYEFPRGKIVGGAVRVQTKESWDGFFVG